MNLIDITNKLRQVLNEIQLDEMGIHQTNYPFPEFKRKALARIEYDRKRNALLRKDKEKANKLYPKQPYGTAILGQVYKGIMVTQETIQHVKNHHPNITDEDWIEFLDTFNPGKDYKERGRNFDTNGEKYIYKCNNENSFFGYVLRTFPSAQYQLVTMFKDTQENVDNWFQNQVNSNKKDVD